MDTMLFMCGTYFALLSGQEHRALRLTPSQIELVRDRARGHFYAILKMFFKNHQGGHKGRKGKRKVVVQHENSKNPSRCFMRLFKLYMYCTLANVHKTDHPMHFI